MVSYRTSEIDKIIAEKLHAVRRKDERIRLIGGILLTVAAIITSFGLLSIAEGLFYFSSPVRTWLVLGTVMCVAVVSLIFLFQPLLSSLNLIRRKSDFELAQLVGRHFPAIKDRLLNLLQISEERKKNGSLYSAELIDASYNDLAETVKNTDLSKSVNFAKPLQIARSIAYGLVFFGVLFLISPHNFSDAMHRIVNYDQEFNTPRDFTLLIEPGDIEVIRGDSVTISVRVEGDPQSEVSLFLRQTGQIDFEEFRLTSQGGASFSYPLHQIRQTTEYYAARKDRQTNRHTITVIDRPTVRRLNVGLEYPLYTGLPPRELDENAGNITALYGTRAAISIQSNKELADARIMFRESEPVQMEINGSSAEAKFTITRDDRYHIALEDADGVPSANPVEYTVRVVRDEYPIVTIVRPGRDINIDTSLRLPMMIRIQDDFGFTRLQLAYRLKASRFEPEHTEYTYVDIPLPSNPSTDEIIEFLWDVRDMRLAPEDVVSYHAVVYDNDMVSGPKRTHSDTYIFRLPSLDEVFAEVDRAQQRSRDDLQYSVEEAEKLRRELDEIQKELQLAQHEMTWERQQRLKEMLDRYDQLQQNLQQMGEELDKMIEEMQRHDVLSPETLEKYLELQELYAQLTDPEFKQAMERLREAMERMDPNELREAMRNMSFNEEQFRQSLERTLSLLKRIQIEQKVDELRKRAEQMVQEQREVETELQKMSETDSEKANQLAQMMEDLQRQLERMMEELAELQRRMEEFPTEMPLAELQKTLDELSEAAMQQLIENMQQQLQRANLQQARQHHRQIQQHLDQMQQNISQMQQSLLEDQMRMVLNEMRRALRNINQLSQRQEQLRDETRSLEPNSQLFRENARSQSEVMSDLSNVVDDLVSLSQKTFAITPDMGRAIGRAFQQMQASLDRLDARSGHQASQHQEGAMASLNEASVMLQQSLEAMMQGGGQGGMQGFLQQLQNMAGQQQQLNIDTRELGQGQMTMEQQAQMARLAQEQEAVRRSLEELKNEMERAQTRERILGDLERIEQEMREVVKDLSAHNLQPETIQRQERILSRLLDAQRSIRQRDFEERREGRVADQIFRESPPELDLSTQEGRDRLREDMLRAIREGYSRDYQLLIRRYFELLQEMEQE